MKKTILIFGGISVLILLIFNISKLSLTNQTGSKDVFLIIVGGIFIGIGFYLNRLFQSNSPLSEKPEEINAARLEKTGLSPREYEILKLINKGLSNAEIGKELFISENTVKTHVSNILMKLHAKRRTQAVQIARDLEIL